MRQGEEEGLEAVADGEWCVKRKRKSGETEKKKKKKEKEEEGGEAEGGALPSIQPRC